MIINDNDNQEFLRVGCKWTEEEDNKLKEEILNKSYEEIAIEHKRTVTGIKSRVIGNIIYPLYKENNSDIEELSLKFKIEKEIINKYIYKIESKSIIKNSITENRKNKDKTIEDKLDKIIILLETLNQTVINII